MIDAAMLLLLLGTAERCCDVQIREDGGTDDTPKRGQGSLWDRNSHKRKSHKTIDCVPRHYCVQPLVIAYA